MHVFCFTGLRAVGDTDDAAPVGSVTPQHPGHLGAAQQSEGGFSLSRGGQQLEEIPLGHQGDVLVGAGQVFEVEVDRLALHLHADGVDQAMRDLSELGSKTEFVKQTQGAGVHRVTAEVAQEVRVLFHHRDVNAGPGQQQAQHHACRSAAGYQNACRFRWLRHWAILGRSSGRSGALVSAAAPHRVSPVSGILNWWDGVELWLSGLPFALQALTVMPVVLGVALISAAILDALLGMGIELMQRVRHSDEASG